MSGGLWRWAALLAGLVAACNGEDKATAPQVQNPGSLAITVQGLPGGVNARVTVSGPGGFQQSVTTTQQLSGLTPGTYTVDALFVTSGAQTFTASPASATVQVQSNAVTRYTVTYSPAPSSSLNLAIAQVTLIQSVQRDNGTIPLIRDRNAYLRVFVIANQANTAAPAVRVRLYSGATLVSAQTTPAPSGNVPPQVNQDQLSSSWNFPILGSQVQSNLAVLVDVDPTNAIAEGDETDNAWPLSGAPKAVQVLGVPSLGVRFVPVRQSATNLTGNVNLANKDQFLDLTRRMHPIGASDTDLHGVYTTSAPALQSDNANGAWQTILSELGALQRAESSTRNYYGVVRTSYSSGVAGIGSIGAPTALGWDRSSVDNITAHELGHNFNRTHAPCGLGTSPSDPNYPYPGADIGVYGLDVVNLSVKGPTVYKDIMSYCSPNWISDYTYEQILNFRGTSPVVFPSQGSPVAGPGLLVWGRIVGDSVVLEPAFQVVAAPVLPSRPGSFRLRGIAVDGSTLIDLSFEGDLVADVPGPPERHFTFVIPVSAATLRNLNTLRLSGPRGQAVQQQRGQAGGARAAGQPVVSLRASGAGRVRVQWDATTQPMVMVRDPTTGEILSFARGGLADVWTTQTNLDLEVSDGVGSVGEMARVR